MSAPFNVLSLFAGIGGFDLGLERTGGFRTVAFCEINPFCRKVLAKHWPDVVQYTDVRTLSAEQLGSDGIVIDVLCGGFPCQDISNAGQRAGIEGERSGLWSEIARLLREFVELGKPVKWVVLENVSALLGRGLGRVLGDLAACGYDAEWDCLPASAVGAPHRRDRIWIVAYPRGEQHEGRGDAFRRALAAGLPAAHLANTSRVQPGRQIERPERQRVGPSGEPIVALAYANGERLERLGTDADPIGRQKPRMGSAGLRDRAGNGQGWWLSEPAVGRVAHGVPSRVDRLHALGNAVVPQIPELIGRAILSTQAHPHE